MFKSVGPKFYGVAEDFKTYGYGGRSLRSFLLAKVLFVVFLGFFSRMEPDFFYYTGASLD